MKTPKISFLVLVAFVLASPSGDILAQESDPDRPRIGLVLSGGGARGASHVGVLKVLERERIPIDLITGTSMGSIVGGLYASGMTADEIEEALVSVDWGAIFDDRIERKERSFRRKTDDRLWLFGTKPGVGDGEVELPPGLVQGQKIALLLTSLSLPVADVESFDDLPIPFRAIAADIQTGETVILGSGNVAKAIRASMSVPAVMAPVPWEGRRLVDGGIASNMPVKVAKDMGADIIIAVDLGAPLSEHDIGESLTGVVDQLSALLVRRNVEESIAMLTEQDVRIRPDLGDIASGQFERVGEAIPTGEIAANLMVDELKVLSLSEEDYAAHVAARWQPSDELPVIAFIRFDNRSSLSDDYLRGRLEIAVRDAEVIGKPMDVELVETAINQLYGLDVFANVNYELVEEDGDHGLLVTALPKGWGPNYLQLGAKWSSSMNGEGVLSIAASLHMTELNSWNAEWRNTLVLGDEPGLLSDFYQPLGRGGKWFLGARAIADEFSVNRFGAGSSDITEQVRIKRYGATLYGGREFGNWGRATVGVTRGAGDREIRIGDPAIPDEDFDIGEVYTTLEVDRLDDLFFPTSGHSLSVTYRKADDTFGASDDFEQLLARGTLALATSKNAFVFGADYRSTISGIAPPERLFRVGGLFNLSGYEFNQLSGQNYAQLIGIFRRDFVRTSILDLSVGASVEYGNVWEDRDDMEFADGLLGGSVFVGAKTPFGPAFIGWGRTEQSDGTFYIYLGSLENNTLID